MLNLASWSGFKWTIGKIVEANVVIKIWITKKIKVVLVPIPRKESDTHLTYAIFSFFRYSVHARNGASLNVGTRLCFSFWERYLYITVTNIIYQLPSPSFSVSFPCHACYLKKVHYSSSALPPQFKDYKKVQCLQSSH